MSFDYQKMADLSVNLIARFGRTATLRTKTYTGPEYDPVITETDTDILAVFTDYRADDVDGTLIKNGDKMLITTTKIETDDEVIDNSVSYEVVSVNEIAPGPMPLIYKVQVRA